MPTQPPEKDEGHPKLDPRLAMLLALEGQGLEELIATERLDLLEIGTQIKELTEQYVAESPEAEAAFLVEIERLYGQLFAPMSAGLLTREDTKGGPEKSGELEVSVFIQAFTSAEQLARHGVRVRSRAGNIFTAFVPLPAIKALEQAPEVQYVELARAVFPSGPPPALAPAPAQARAQPQPALVRRRASATLDGSGTIIGVIDSTLDLYHPDFRHVQGARTRVLYLWDQTLQPQGAETGPTLAAGDGSPNAFRYGVEYKGADIDKQLFDFPFTPAYQDVRHNQAGEIKSHGTAVTGIAAGNGRGNAAYPGSAPAADIIFVAQTDPHSVDLLSNNVEVMDAFSYIFERAAELGRPCVVNLSNGDNLGPHDGSSLGECFLDALLETPGRAVTLSAGNSTGTSSHATGTLTQGASMTLEVQCDPPAVRSDTVEIWYDGKDRFDATLAVPGLAPFTVAPGAFLTRKTPDGVQVTLSSIVGSAGSNHISIIFLVPSGKAMPQGKTSITVTATKVTATASPFHAWIDRNNRDHDTGIASVRFMTHVDEASLTLGTPGTARHPITVGNHDDDRKIAGTSGLGPTRDGRMKPELAALGVEVKAPYSWNRASSASPIGLYAPANGTSASAPWVAGACACLFQRYGIGLTWAHLKQLLADTASPFLPRNGFGYGCLETGPLLGSDKPQVDVWIMGDPADTGLGPNAAPVIWASPDIQVLDTQRQGVANLTRAAAGAAATNIVRVRVRNRGTQAAMNTQVVVAWTEGTTYARSGTWQSAGLFVDAATNFATPGNVHTIPSLAPGAFTDVEFGFAAPAGLADQPLTLIVRLDNALDPWLATSQSGSALGMRNNLAMRTVLVATPAPGAAATMQFNVVGNAAGESDCVVVTSDVAAAQVRLRLPLAALPASRHGSVTGQSGINVAGNDVEITMAKSPMRVPFLALAPGQSVVAKLTVTGVPPGAGTAHVAVAQRSGGLVIGGASLEVRT